MENGICSLAEQGLICFTSWNSASIHLISPKLSLSHLISRSVHHYCGINYHIVPKPNMDFSCLPSRYKIFTIFGQWISRWSAEFLTFKISFGVWKSQSKKITWSYLLEKVRIPFLYLLQANFLFLLDILNLHSLCTLGLCYAVRRENPINYVLPRIQLSATNY